MATTMTLAHQPSVSHQVHVRGIDFGCYTNAVHIDLSIIEFTYSNHATPEFIWALLINWTLHSSNITIKGQLSTYNGIVNIHLMN